MAGRFEKMTKRKFFDTYKEAMEFMDKIGEDRVVNYGKETIMGELKSYVEYKID